MNTCSHLSAPNLPFAHGLILYAPVSICFSCGMPQPKRARGAHGGVSEKRLKIAAAAAFLILRFFSRRPEAAKASAKVEKMQQGARSKLRKPRPQRSATMSGLPVSSFLEVTSQCTILPRRQTRPRPQMLWVAGSCVARSGSQKLSCIRGDGLGILQHSQIENPSRRLLSN